MSLSDEVTISLER